MKRKRCLSCSTARYINQFGLQKSSPDGHAPNCLRCVRKDRELKAEQTQEARRAWEQKVRLEGITHYGGMCACCQERQPEFLLIVPTKRGAKLRAGVRNPLPYWLKQHNYPAGFRVLCHNCAEALTRFGYCPHDEAGTI